MSSPDPRAGGSQRGRRGGSWLRRVLGAVVYWLAVVVISLALVVGLVLFLESRDRSEVDEREGAGASAAPQPGRALTSRAKTTIRWAAL